MTEHNITIEQSQSEGKGKTWWWISGDTYPVRKLLKLHGGRWSKRRRAWYFITEQLPDAIAELADTATVDHEDRDETPSAAIHIQWADGTREYEQRFRSFCERFDNQIYAQDIFSRTLVHQGEWVTRREYVEIAHRQELPMRRGQQNPGENPTYWIGQRSVSVEEFDYLGFLQDQNEPCSVVEASAQLGLPVAETPAPQIDEPAAEEQHIRVIEPDLNEHPDMQLAIREAALIRPKPTPASRIVQSQRIPQAFCGELTGSITGQVFCYGFAVQHQICTYLNLAGPRMAVEAIRARLGRGEVVNLVQPDGPSIELTAGDRQTGKYTAYMQNIPEAKYTSVILVHEQITEPNYNGKATTGIFHLSDEQAMAQLTHHVRELVKVPVFDAWTGYLWHAGQTAQLVRNAMGGGLPVKSVEMDIDAWTRLITGGLQSGVIYFQ